MTAPSFHKSGGRETCGLQRLRLYLTFNKTEYSYVATADYGDAAGDGGGRGLPVTVKENGGTGSNKAGFLTDPSAADPMCLCQFMDTV